MNKKDTKAQAEYEDPAKNPTKHCSLCQYFRTNYTCAKVQGGISPKAWCHHYLGSK
jgi:hypothetical protein